MVSSGKGRVERNVAGLGGINVDGGEVAVVGHFGGFVVARADAKADRADDTASARSVTASRVFRASYW